MNQIVIATIVIAFCSFIVTAIAYSVMTQNHTNSAEVPAMILPALFSISIASTIAYFLFFDYRDFLGQFSFVELLGTLLTAWLLSIAAMRTENRLLFTTFLSLFYPPSALNVFRGQGFHMRLRLVVEITEEIDACQRF